MMTPGELADPLAPSAALSNDNRPRRFQLTRRPVPIATEAKPARVAPDAFTEMRDWIGVLERLRIPVDIAARIAARADLNRTAFQEELLASGMCDENGLYRAIAAELGLRFMAAPDPRKLIVRERDFRTLLSAGARQSIQYLTATGPVNIVGYDAFHLAAMRRFLAMDGRLRDRIVVVPRRALRDALKIRLEPTLAANACDALVVEVPDCSARTGANAWQGSMLAMILMGAPIGLSLWPNQTLIAFHALVSLFFLACIFIRFSAAREAHPPVKPKLRHVHPRDLPTYSVMVALYREAAVVPQLLEALGSLAWPKSKLEVKLVCEADDHATMAAIRAANPGPYIEIVAVPPTGPRTKPKALNFALPLTTGALVAIFDAEDRPEKLQLLEAWQTFEAAGPELGCLQAPLVVANGGESLLARLFAFEYAALFRGLLPWLAARSLVLPLGGTSNHFRRAALDDVGAWDPYNVTEDADLGLRLARFGYRIGTISYPTYEDAPTNAGVWLRQRTRWFKGWLQTWLVHMRHPFRLWRELGTGSFLIFQVLMAGMVISALCHPLLLLFVGYIVAEILYAGPDPSRSLLFAIDSINVFCGYAAFLALGTATLMPLERRALWPVVLLTPIYWLMISAAAWRAVWQLYRNPFLWEKTPHLPSTAPPPAIDLSQASATFSPAR